MQPLNPKFHNTFSSKELETLINDATASSYDTIVIATEDYFFELSSDRGEELEIYCDEHSNSSNRILSKEEFLKLYPSSKMLEVVNLEMDE